MTNFPDSGLDDLSPPDDVAAQKLSNDLRSLIEVQPDVLPRIDFGRVPTVAPATRRVLPARGWRVALVGATAAAVALFLTSGAGLLSHGTPEVSAQAILDRTQTAADTYAPADQDVSYHLVATSTTTGSRPITTETWWADAQHFKTEVLDPDGQVLSEQVRNGNDFWVATRVDGELKAAHTTVDDNLLVSAGAMSGAGVSFAAGGPGMVKGGCGAPVSSGTEQVAGRSTYVIEMPTQTDGACGPVLSASTDGKGAGVQSRSETIMGGSGPSLTGTPPDGASGMRVAGIAINAQPDEAPAYQPQGRIDVTLWVDQATFITLRSEARDATGNVFNTYEVGTFDVGMTPPASTFEKPAASQTVEASSMEELLPALMGN